MATYTSYLLTQARELGLRFEALNEPGVWGPFASFFYTQENDEKPFIILALKGTTPDNFAEVRTDYCRFGQFELR